MRVRGTITTTTATTTPAATSPARSRARRARIAVVAIVPVVALLAGCSGVEAGSAATVGGSSISETSLQDGVQTFLDSLPAANRSTEQAELAQVQTGILSAMVVEKVVDQIAAARGITITPAEVSSRVQADIQAGGASLEQQLITLYLTRAGLPAFERTNLQFVGIGATLPTKGLTAPQIQVQTLAFIKAQAARLPVRLSPRYGVWDGSTLSLSGGPQSISTAGPTAPATPAVFS